MGIKVTISNIKILFNLTSIPKNSGLTIYCSKALNIIPSLRDLVGQGSFCATDIPSLTRLIKTKRPVYNEENTPIFRSKKD
jgi:hypothetical protein